MWLQSGYVPVILNLIATCRFSVHGYSEATLKPLMAYRYEEKKEIDDFGRSSAAQVDVVAIRLEVDDHYPLPPSVRELMFNSSSPDTQESSAGAPETPSNGAYSCHHSTRIKFIVSMRRLLFTCAGGLDDAESANSKEALGQRLLHDITVETYAPKGKHVHQWQAAPAG